jgi:putative methyltransferase (TIGR04325 family)
LAAIPEIYPNYPSALAACGPGYNDADMAEVIAYKTALPIEDRQLAPEQAIVSILSLGIVASEIADRPLTVLDFGGGCGFHYFRVASAIRTPLRWAIVETPAMAERAAKLARGRFEVFTDIAAAAEALGHVDLVHASSSIQYVPEPLATLKTLAALRARYFALARFPVWGGAQLVFVQTSTLAANGVGPMPPNIADRKIKYPVTFTNYDEVLRTLGQYEPALAIHSPSAVYEIGGQYTQGVTAIFRLRKIPPTA